MFGFIFIVIFSFFSCVTGSTVGDSPCEELCLELVNQCGFSAYPDYTSCLEGCVYNETEKDQQTSDMPECTLNAACDEFEIMECEHQYGADSE